MKKINKKGFTIVEIVIVIAVIAILAAVLIPTFSTVIEKSKMASAERAATNALRIIESDEAENFKTHAYYFLTKEGYVYTYSNGVSLHMLANNGEEIPFGNKADAKNAIKLDAKALYKKNNGNWPTLEKVYALDKATAESVIDKSNLNEKNAEAIENIDLKSMNVIVYCYVE